MRKNVFGRQFKRDVNERKALFKGLMSSLVLQERIQTTEEKAKAIRSQVERLVTKARVGGRSAESLMQPYLSSLAVKKMMTDVAPRFAKRPGGYTRMVKIGKRFNDNANLVIMEWVEKPTNIVVSEAAPKKKLKAKALTKPTAAKEDMNVEVSAKKVKKPVKSITAPKKKARGKTK